MAGSRAPSFDQEGPHQLHTPLSSTYQFHTKGPLLFSPQKSSVSHTPHFYKLGVETTAILKQTIKAISVRN